MNPPSSSPIRWAALNELFAPFRGTDLYAIRADLFFHLALAGTRPRHYQAKNCLYPLALARRMHTGANAPGASDAEFAFVCDYAAEPGFGTLRPIMDHCDRPQLFIGNSAVLRARGQELSRRKKLAIVDADSCPVSLWQPLWRRSRYDLERLCDRAAPSLRDELHRCRFVIRALLVRAYWYKQLLAELFANGRMQAVITHNDFASLSHLAGHLARHAGIADVTLQHGFPSQEYFPTTASHYLVWGERFRSAMLQADPAASGMAVVGAPRLDALAQTDSTRQRATNERARVLYFSQTHAPIFTGDEHSRILDTVAAIAHDAQWELHIRLHPQEDEKVYKSDPRFRHALIQPRSTPLKDAVLQSDVVLSTNSTAMLEAALLHRPVVQLALPGLEDRIGLLQFPVQVDSTRGLQAALEGLLVRRDLDQAMEAQDEFLRSCVHDPGNGTRNAWEYIANLHPAQSPAAFALSS